MHSRQCEQRCRPLAALGLVCITFLAVPASAVECSVDSDATPSCTRSLLQHSVSEERTSKHAEAAMPPPMKAVAKAHDAAKTANDAAAMMLEKSRESWPDKDIVKVTDDKAAPAKFTAESSPKASTDARQGLKEAMRSGKELHELHSKKNELRGAKAGEEVEAHAAAKTLVQFSIGAWEVLTVVLIIAVIFVGVGAFTPWEKQAPLQRLPPAPYGGRAEYNQSQYGFQTKPVGGQPQYGAGYGRDDSFDNVNETKGGCCSPTPSKKQKPAPYGEVQYAGDQRYSEGLHNAATALNAVDKLANGPPNRTRRPNQSGCC